MGADTLVWLLFAVCLALSFVLSGMEAGVFALSRLRIRQQMRAGRRSARVLHDYLENPENFLWRSEEHTSELQSRLHLVCRLLLEKKKKITITVTIFNRKR